MAYQLFEPVRIGPKVLRNRTIRAAAFEGMAPSHVPSSQLLAYHRAVSQGGVGMSTVAYAAVEQSGLAFPHQLLLQKEFCKELTELTDGIHEGGALASVQLGHCGNMANVQVAGTRPLSPSGKYNLYGTSWPRAMDTIDIQRVVRSFGEAVRVAQDSGFDAIEVHAGHGYLISQFLSPRTNHRQDEYGGSLSKRMRFLREVISEVCAAAKNRLAILVKMNLSDGVEGGQDLADAVEIAKCLEQEGAHALVLSGGFVSASPMYVMRGEMPIDVMSALIPSRFLRTFLRLFGRFLIPSVPYQDNYFLQDAKVVRSNVKLPLVYVGGAASRQSIEEVLAAGFEAVAMARALIADPAFVRKLAQEGEAVSVCDHCNYCAARIYTTEMACHKRQTPEPVFQKILQNRGLFRAD